MDAQIERELAHGRTADITTIGRRSGQPHRREMWQLTARRSYAILLIDQSI
jgi:hypothetical protein